MAAGNDIDRFEDRLAAEIEGEKYQVRSRNRRYGGLTYPARFPTPNPLARLAVDRV
jgi:hypothetical protein